jgi:hypothetical protein
MTQDNLNSPSNAGPLNEFQARHLYMTFRYIDKLLCEIEDVLNAASSRAAFPKYSPDVAPAESRQIEEHIARIRSQLVRVLDAQGITRQVAYISASHAIHAALGSIGIALEELKPPHMRGYGELPQAAADELDGIVDDLRELVAQLGRSIAESDRQTGRRQARKGESHQRA